MSTIIQEGARLRDSAGSDQSFSDEKTGLDDVEKGEQKRADTSYLFRPFLRADPCYSSTDVTTYAVADFDDPNMDRDAQILGMCSLSTTKCSTSNSLHTKSDQRMILPIQKSVPPLPIRMTQTCLRRQSVHGLLVSHRLCMTMEPYVCMTRRDPMDPNLMLRVGHA